MFYYACHRWLESVGSVRFRSYFRLNCFLRSGDNGHSCDVQQFGVKNNRRRGQYLNNSKTRQRKKWKTVNKTTVFAHKVIMSTYLPSSIVVFFLSVWRQLKGGGRVCSKITREMVVFIVLFDLYLFLILEAEFLDKTQPKVSRVFLLSIHSNL